MGTGLALERAQQCLRLKRPGQTFDLLPILVKNDQIGKTTQLVPLHKGFSFAGIVFDPFVMIVALNLLNDDLIRKRSGIQSATGRAPDSG
jgi:hypothetical protein